MKVETFLEEDMLNIGIIGCGKIAQTRHIPEYAAHSKAHLFGFFDLNSQRAATLAKTYGGKAYESVEALLSDPEIDAVSVCTANTTHADLTVRALLSGKHVLCEKPMATTLADCEAMVKAAKKSGKKLMIGHNQRLAVAHQLAKELIDAGRIGTILTFRTAFGHGGPETWSVDPGKNTWFFDPKSAAMGAMADLGIHKTDLIGFLTGQRVIRTTARLLTLDKRDGEGKLIGVDDNAFCIYEMSGGAVGTMTASWTHYGAEDNSTVLYGTKGILRLYDDPSAPVKVITEEGKEETFAVEGIQTNDNQTASGVIDLFMECLLEDKEMALSGESALSAMRAVFGSLESARLGKTVEIPENR